MRLEVLYRICALHGYNLHVDSYLLGKSGRHVGYWLHPGSDNPEHGEYMTHGMCHSISEVPEKVLATLETLPKRDDDND